MARKNNLQQTAKQILARSGVALPDPRVLEITTIMITGVYNQGVVHGLEQSADLFMDPPIPGDEKPIKEGGGK